MVFHDEFSASAVNVIDGANGYVKLSPNGPTWRGWYPSSASFTAQSPGGEHTNNVGREQEYYALSGLSVGSSILTMTATHDNVHAGLPYTSGMVQSNPSFNFKYGYMEARLRMSRIGGTWPAFWLIPASYTWPPEVDIMEQFGTENAVRITTWQNSSSAPGSLSAFGVSLDPRQWHVYGCKWTATDLTFYVDGTQVAQETVATNVPQEKMYLVLDLAVDGNQTIDNANFPTTFQADYVRVWQQGL